MQLPETNQSIWNYRKQTNQYAITGNQPINMELPETPQLIWNYQIQTNQYGITGNKPIKVEFWKIKKGTAKKTKNMDV